MLCADKLELYEKLEETCTDVPRNDILFIIGDLNSQFGREEYNQDVADKEIIHAKTNDNGDRFWSLATTIKLTLYSFQ